MYYIIPVLHLEWFIFHFRTQMETDSQHTGKTGWNWKKDMLNSCFPHTIPPKKKIRPPKFEAMFEKNLHSPIPYFFTPCPRAHTIYLNKEKLYYRTPLISTCFIGKHKNLNFDSPLFIGAKFIFYYFTDHYTDYSLIDYLPKNMKSFRKYSWNLPVWKYTKNLLWHILSILSQISEDKHDFYYIYHISIKYSL